MASDRMMEYYYSMGQDTLAAGDIDEAVTYFRKAANLGAGRVLVGLLDPATLPAGYRFTTRDAGADSADSENSNARSIELLHSFIANQ